MKKAIITLMTTLLLPVIAIADYYDLDGNTGELRFIGEIGGSRGCTITGLGDGIVQMPSVYADDFNRNGGTSGWGEITIYLTDCTIDPEEESYGINLNILQGDANEDNPDLWKNGGDAEGVGIEIQLKITSDGTTNASNYTSVEPEGTGDYPFYLEYTGQRDPSFTFRGRMVKAGSSVTAGSVETTVAFEISYP